jgi:hypothetical protein
MMPTKATFVIICLVLIAVTAYATWLLAGIYFADQFATLETNTRNLLVQVGQLTKEGGPQSPQVYGISRLQLLDIHVNYDPPHRPSIFGNVVNKGALAARDPATGAAYVAAASDLTAQEFDDLAAQAVNARIGNRGLEFKPDEVHGFSFDFNLTQEQFEDIKSGRQKFYLIYVLSHVDEAVPPGKMRLTEACYVYANGLAPGQLCPEHNRALTVEARPSR